MPRDSPGFRTFVENGAIRLSKIVFFLQILAIVLYPLASADRAAAATSIEQASDVGATHDHLISVATRDRQYAQADATSDVVDTTDLQSVSSGDFDTSDCCCAGPVGLCLTLVSGAPRAPLVSGDSRVEPQRESIFIGTIPALIPHPPKILS